jgi:hypothetical protein
MSPNTAADLAKPIFRMVPDDEKTGVQMRKDRRSLIACLQAANDEQADFVIRLFVEKYGVQHLPAGLEKWLDGQKGRSNFGDA